MITETTKAALPRLADRLAATACVAGSFTLTDGKVLGAYFDEYRLAADPRLLHDIAVEMAALIPENTDMLAGIELGGVPLVVALSAVTGLPAVFLRRLPKRYGSKRQIEGADVQGRHVALVDDVVRSGRQLLSMARLLLVAEAAVTDALCVLERPLGGRTLLTQHGITLRPLLDEAALPTAGAES